MTSKPIGSVSWFQVFQCGQHYMKTWPSDKCLASVSPGHRVACTTRFAIRFMPPLAIFTLTWQIALGGQLGPAIATARCSLVFCRCRGCGGWAAARSRHCHRCCCSGLLMCATSWRHPARGVPTEGIPTYQALTDLLKRAFRQLDKTFLDDLNFPRRSERKKVAVMAITTLAVRFWPVSWEPR